MEKHEQMKSRFIDLCLSNIDREGIKNLLAWLEKSDFYRAPASTKYHGSYEGGLLEHSLNVFDQALLLQNSFHIDLPLESVTIAALFHDLCKVNFYKEDTRNVKVDGKWQSVPCYSIEEKFCYGGHGSKSVFLVERFMKLEPEEAIAINCHMGAWDGNKDVGKAYEKSPLAFIVHAADECATFLIVSRENND